MSRVLGLLLFVAAVARAESGTETVEQAVRACTAATTADDLRNDSLTEYCMADVAADRNAGEAGVVAIPFPGSVTTPISADGDATTKPWEITGALGFTLTSGNSDTVTLLVGAKALREWEKWKLAMRIGILYAKSNHVETASEWMFVEKLERKLSERATIFQALLLEHDEQEDLAYRIQFTMGYNRRLKKSEKFELWGNVGGGVLYEKFFDDEQTEGIAQVGINFTWQITKTLKYEQIITFFPSLSESGEFRFYWESVFTTPISDRFDLRISILDRYDSNPQPGVKDNDLTIAVALAINFTKPPPKE
jgi:putative salt-induced outer membrane protein